MSPAEATEEGIMPGKSPGSVLVFSLSKTLCQESYERPYGSFISDGECHEYRKLRYKLEKCLLSGGRDLPLTKETCFIVDRVRRLHGSSVIII